jgi:phage shock protein E
VKIFIVIAGIMVLLVGGFFLFSEPSSDESLSPQTSNSEVSIETVNNDIENGALFLDVRTPEEYADSYISGATNFTLQDLQQGKLPNVEAQEKIYVYCRSGNRSAEAKTILENSGFTNVVDLGGLEDVVSIGGVKVN